MPIELLALRLLHILGGIFWVGGGLYSTFFVMPALAKAGPAIGPIMAELQRRRLFTVLPLTALITMLSGLRLLWIVSGGFSAGYFHTTSGLTYAVSGAASLVGFLIALLVSRPASVRMGSLAATMPSLEVAARAAAEAELAALKTRAAVGTALAVLLLTAAAVGMAVARYL